MRMTGQELTLDFAGITRLWLMRRRTGRVPDVLWHPTQVAFGESVQLSEMWGLEPIERMRLLRLNTAVRANSGPKLAKGIAEATSVGDVTRGLRYLDIWMGRLDWTARNEAEISLHLRRLQRRLRSILHEERMIPVTRGYKRELGCGLLMMMDMPAWLAPFAVALHQRMLGPEPLQVISGGDRLSPGIWCWDFAAGQGEVILRSCAQDAVAVTAMLQRQAFEPPSGRRT